jgi:hypothetical protein
MIAISTHPETRLTNGVQGLHSNKVAQAALLLCAHVTWRVSGVRVRPTPDHAHER